MPLTNANVHPHHSSKDHAVYNISKIIFLIKTVVSSETLMMDEKKQEQDMVIGLQCQTPLRSYPLSLIPYP